MGVTKGLIYRTLFGRSLRTVGHIVSGTFSSGWSDAKAENALDNLVQALGADRDRVAPSLVWSAAVVLLWLDGALGEARMANAFERKGEDEGSTDSALADLLNAIAMAGPHAEVVRIVANGTDGWVTEEMETHFAPGPGPAPPGDSLLAEASVMVEFIGLADTARRDLLGAVLDVLLEDEERRYEGEFSTPPDLAQLLAALADPKPGERVVDPACGRGTLLAACVQRAPGAEVVGTDVVPAAVLVAAARVVLAGGDPSGLRNGDALAPDVLADADVLVLDPPLGLRLEQPHVGPLGETRNGDVAFVQAALSRLHPGGRAVIVVPTGFLGSRAALAARRALLSEFAVDAVIELRDVPHLVNRAVLCVSRREPHDDVWFTAAGVVGGAMRDARALAALARGVAHRRGGVSVDALRREASNAPSPLDLVDWFEPETNAPPPKTAEEDAEARARAAWAYVSDVVADVLLPGGWYDEVHHERPAAGVSWLEPVEWLLDRDASLVPRQTGARELQDFLDRAREIASDSVRTPALSEVAEVFRGTRIRSEDLSDDPRAVGPAYVRVSDVTDDGTRRPPRRLLVEPDSARRLQEGDVLLTLSGSVGRVARVPDALAGAVPSADLAVIRSRPDLQADYLVALLWTVPYQRWLHGHATGVTIQHIRLSELEDLPILFVHEEDQRDLAMGLRRGDGAARPLAIIGNREENLFAQAIASDTRLRELDDPSLGTNASDIQAVGQELREGLWHTAIETGALKATYRFDWESGERGGEPVYNGRADDPFAEWLVSAQAAFAVASTVEDLYGGAERLVVIDGIARRLRRALDLVRSGLTETDLTIRRDGGPQFKDGLLLPPPARGGTSAPLTGVGRQAVERAEAALAFVERARDSFRESLMKPLNSPFAVRIEPDSVELGRPTDLLVFVKNESPVSVHGVRATCYPPRPGSGDRPLRIEGVEEASEVFDNGFLPQDWEKDEVLRLPAIDTTGTYSLDFEFTYVHLDGERYVEHVTIPVSVRGNREAADGIDFGSSPYVVGDPVSNPDLFFGRRGAREDLRTDRPARPDQPRTTRGDPEVGKVVRSRSAQA